MSLEELEQDPFDPKEYVERIAWRKTGALSKENVEKFNPMNLHAEFKRKIEELKELNAKVEHRASVLETAVKDEERKHWNRVSQLQTDHGQSVHKFEALAEKITFVAAKVVHLGDQLEGVNIPRQRAVDAEKLMKHFAEFLDVNWNGRSPLWTDPAKMEEAADVIQKMYTIALDLPSGERFDLAKKRVADKYFEIERLLINEFLLAQHRERIPRMRAMAQALTQFKGYNQCVDEFIQESQKFTIKPGSTVFDEVLPLCVKAHVLINEVFPSPEAVMGKFVLNIFNGRLKDHILEQLEMNKNDKEEHLKTLHQLHTRTSQLATDLSNARLDSDAAFLSKLTKNIFARYLEAYPSLETSFLKEKCDAILTKFYDSVGHQKRNLHAAGIFKLTSAGAMSSSSSDCTPAQSLVSQEVAINLLQEIRHALDRCSQLTDGTQSTQTAFQIFEIMAAYLFKEHIEYGVEIGLQGISGSDPKSAPSLLFLDTCSQCNTVIHLCDKLNHDSFNPLFSASAAHNEVSQRMRSFQATIEDKLEGGVEKTLNSVLGWVKHILSSEQKKSDFRIESDKESDFNKSSACSKVLRYLEPCLACVRDSLDGGNLQNVLCEFGIKLHRVVHDHILNFQYSSIGAILAICDVAEYRKLALTLDVPLVAALFDTLHALLNLLVVPPENLPQVSAGDQLALLDRSVLHSFVQLRADYKQERLAVHFRT